MNRVMSVTSVGTHVTLFPNGIIHPDESDDVLVGTGRLVSITVSDTVAAAESAIIKVYNCAIGDAGRAIRGGTSSADEVYRSIAGATLTATAEGDAFIKAAPNSQITASRLVADIRTELTAEHLTRTFSFEELTGVMGLAVHVQFDDVGSAADQSVTLEFEPHISGGTRFKRESLPTPHASNIPL